MNRNLKGQYSAMRPAWRSQLIPAFLILTGLVIYGIRHIKPVEAQNATASDDNCVEVQKGEFDCSSVLMHAKWKAYQDDLIKKQNEEIAKLKGLTFQAIRTRYSRADSCHNPRGNECLTAIGRDTKQGTTVACPRNIALGTRIVLSDEPNHVYVCEDRYLEELDSQRGRPTIDVFAEESDLDKLPARKVVTVRIIE